MNNHKKVYDGCVNNTKLYFWIICFIFIIYMAANSNAMSCESCGRECAMACGTKHFRTCCFNYLRKRSDPTILKLKPLSSSASISISDAENTPEFLINGISDEQLYDPNINYHVLEQILDDIRQDSKSLEMEVRKALNTRKAEYAEKKHRLKQQQQQQQQPQQQNLPQKEIDY